jgi:hypothetical protein
MKLFNKKEIRNIIVVSLVLGFVFSFRNWGHGASFSYNIGIYNWFHYFIAALIVLLIYQGAHKLAANAHGCKSRFHIWGINRYWVFTRSKISNLKIFGKKFSSLKIGIVLPLLFVFLSNGFIKFCAIASSEISEVRLKRIGKKFKNVTDFEIATIHLMGPLTILVLALLLNNFPSFGKIVEISYLLAIYSMLPLSELDGAKIFFGSPLLYIFSLAFMILAITFIRIASPITTIIFALLAALIIFLYFLAKHSHLA